MPYQPHQHQLPKRSQATTLGCLLFIMLFSLQAKAGLVQVFEWGSDNPTVERVTDLCPGPCSGVRGNAVVFDNQLMFSGNKLPNAKNLWALDSNDELSEISSANNVPFNEVGSLTPSGNNLYFSAFSPNSGQELWRYDGNNATLAQDFAAGVSSSQPRPQLGYNNELLVSAAADAGTGLYKVSNGTAELIALGSQTYDATHHQGEVWMAFNDSQFGTELWRYDGTNFSLALDIEPGAQGSTPRLLGSIGTELVYSAYEWFEQSLFKGEPLAGSVGSSDALVFNNNLYYGGTFGEQGVHDQQLLIRYDGYSQSALADADVNFLGSHKQTIYFSGFANGEDDVDQVWRYRNGLVERIDSGIPGVRLKAGRRFTEFANKLYFQASTQDHGLEWWSLNEAPKLGKIQMQLVPMWDNKYLWQFDLSATGKPIDLTYVIYRVANTGEITQMTQQQVYLDEHTVHTNTEKGQGFSDKEQGIATLVVAFESKSQRKLFLHAEVTAKDKSFDAQAAARLEGVARRYGQKLQYKTAVEARSKQTAKFNPPKKEKNRR